MTRISFIFCVMVASFSLQAQECNSQMTPTTPTSAFTINADGTVTDNRTGLVWDRCTWGQTGADCSGGAATTHNWQGALAQAEAANSANYKGHSDWRLANIKELTSIVERSCYDPAVNLTLFSNTPSSLLWSSSPDADYANYAWSLDVNYGDVHSSARNNEHWQVRLVRGGQ
ncbi:MAG: DUF1566 domain-containing protein [Gammaproteobacteria bacterium]|nr:DUF1566 domain-containing protein [Gammaproteobacteria bacterium]